MDFFNPSSFIIPKISFKNRIKCHHILYIFKGTSTSLYRTLGSLRIERDKWIFQFPHHRQSKWGPQRDEVSLSVTHRKWLTEISSKPRTLGHHEYTHIYMMGVHIYKKELVTTATLARYPAWSLLCLLLDLCCRMAFIATSPSLVLSTTCCLLWGVLISQCLLLAWNLLYYIQSIYSHYILRSPVT